MDGWMDGCACIKATPLASPFPPPSQTVPPPHTHTHSGLCFFLRGRVVVEQPLDPKQQYIFGAHPHGINTWNHFLTVCQVAVLCCAVLCCAVLCCAVLCCAVLCCAVLCCAVGSVCRSLSVDGMGATR